MKTKRLALRTVIAGVVLLGTTVERSGSAEPERLTSLKNGFFSALARLENRYDPLNQAYQGALRRLQESEAKAGNLENALAAKRESEAFSQASGYDEAAFEKRFSEWAELSRLQVTYRDQRRTLDREVEPARKELAQRYDQELEKLQDELTRAGDLEGAVAVKKAQEGFRTDPSFAVYFGGQAEVKSLRGKIVFVTKGEIEFFHRGKSLSYRNSYEGSEADIRKTGETRGLEDFQAGDLVVIRARSTAAYRGVAMALVSEDESNWIPVRPEMLRYLGAAVDAAAVTKERAMAIQPGGVDSGGIDAIQQEEWSKLGLPPAEKGGSQWFRSETTGEWHTWALILEPEMLVPLEK